MKPSNSQSTFLKGPGAIPASLLSILAFISLAWQDIDSDYSPPPPPFPKKSGVNPSVNHLLLKPFCQAGSAMVPNPGRASESPQELNNNINLDLVHLG